MNINYSRIKDMAFNERPRERMLRFGANSLSNSELLAIIISSGSSDNSAIELADRVLSLEEDSIFYLSNYQPDEFKEIKGIGTAIACKIAASIEFGKRVATAPANRVKLSEPIEIATYYSGMRSFNKEHFKVAMFNVKNELIMEEDISIGGLTSASALPREVYANAIRKGAYAVIFIHNHPSGDPTPSADDVSTTNQLVSAGKILGVKVWDHIIIGDGKYFSFREENLIK